MRFAALLSLLLAAPVLVTAPAWAQRPSTLSMSCAEARGLVAARGGVVLSTGARTYERFVASARSCLPGEYAYPAYAPTRDRSSCRLGYRCDPSPPIWERDRGLFGGDLFGR